MNKGIYAFVKEGEVFVFISKADNPTEWEALNELDGYEVECDDMFYIMGTDAWGELEETPSEKLLVYKSIDHTYFKCPVSDEVLDLLTKDDNGFMLIQNDLPLDENEVYELFLEEEIEGLVCAFFTEEAKREFFELDE